MDQLAMLPGARRDNAGYVSVPVEIPHGCRGAACPAFDICQGRTASRPVRVADERRQ